jgi:hypothetical protein
MIKHQEDKMSNLIGKVEKMMRTLGMFGIMLSLAGALAASAPAASASTLGSAAGATTESAVSSLKAAPDGKLALFVINRTDGSRVAGAQVVVIDVSGRSVAKGLTGADGYFATLVPAGIYKVAIIAKGFLPAGQVTEVKSNQGTLFKIGVLPVHPPNL